jgi:DNA repair protein RecO (recombination protein O)
MPLYTTDALVLRTYKLAEADRIVVFLTRDRGKKRGVAKGARRPRSRFVGALEPFSHVRMAYFEKERRELVSLNYAEVERSPMAAAGEGVSYAGYFAELVDECAPESDPNEMMYRLGASVVEAMAAGVQPEPLARYFEYWLLRLQGVYPSFHACHGCGGDLAEGPEAGAWLAPGDAVFTCGQCAPGENAHVREPNLSGAALAFLREARRAAPMDVPAIPASAGVLHELEDVHRALIVRHLERELRSTRVLRDIRRPAPDEATRESEFDR